MVRQLERFECSNPSVKKQIHLFRTPLTRKKHVFACFFRRFYAFPAPSKTLIFRGAVSSACKFAPNTTNTRIYRFFIAGNMI